MKENTLKHIHIFKQQNIYRYSQSALCLKGRCDMNQTKETLKKKQKQKIQSENFFVSFRPVRLKMSGGDIIKLEIKNKTRHSVTQKKYGNFLRSHKHTEFQLVEYLINSGKWQKWKLNEENDSEWIAVAASISN